MVITGAFIILAYCADKHGSQNFQEVVRDVLGPGAYVTTEVIVLLYMFGSSVAYMIIIGDQLESGEYFFHSGPVCTWVWETLGSSEILFHFWKKNIFSIKVLEIWRNNENSLNSYCREIWTNLLVYSAPLKDQSYP